MNKCSSLNVVCLCAPASIYDSVISLFANLMERMRCARNKWNKSSMANRRTAVWWLLWQTEPAKQPHTRAPKMKAKAWITANKEIYRVKCFVRQAFVSSFCFRSLTGSPHSIDRFLACAQYSPRFSIVSFAFVWRRKCILHIFFSPIR